MQAQKQSYVQSVKKDLIELKKILGSSSKRRESVFWNKYEDMKKDSLNELLMPQQTTTVSNVNAPKKQQFLLRVKSSATIRRNEHLATKPGSAFKNELLQKTLNNENLVAQPDQTVDLALTQQQPLTYRERIMKHHKPHPSLLLATQSTTSLGGASLTTDAIQQTMIQNLLNDFTRDSSKYSSILVHLGVLLQQAQSLSLSARLPQPSTLLTQVAAFAFEHFTSLFPQLSSFLVPLKSMLLQGLFCNYTSASPNDSKDHMLKYETYHDRLQRVTKEMKQLRRQVVEVRNDRGEEKRQKGVIKNMLKKIMREKEKQVKTQIFNALRLQTGKKYQNLYNQLSENTSFGEKAAQKMTLRRCFMQWELFKSSQKLSRSTKEISYYQTKYDDLEAHLATAKAALAQLNQENYKLQMQLTERNSKLESRNKELQQAKVTSSTKKPQQVRKLLKLYFKYLYSNPYITRIRIRQLSTTTHQQSSNPFPSFSQQRQSIGDYTQCSHNNSHYPFNLRLLLKKRERLHEGGPGVKLIQQGMSLKELMTRWLGYMVEKAVVKVGRLIEMLEMEVQVREYCKEQKRMGRLTSEDEDEDEEDCEELEDEEGCNENDDGEEQSCTQAGYSPPKSPNPRPPSQCLNIRSDANLQAPISEKKKPYIPFKCYKEDLIRLLTFKALISKSLHQQLDITLVENGYLLALAFVLDYSERKIKLSNSEYMQNAAKLATMGQPNKKNQQRLSVMMMPFQMVTGEEDKKEEVTVPEYKYVLQFVEAVNDIKKRAQLTVGQLEKVMQHKIDWYFTLDELISGTSSVYTTLLASMFYWHSILDQQNHSLALKEAQKLTPEQLQDEDSLNQRTFKQVLEVIQCKTLPLLQRKMNSCHQDVSQMFSLEEVKICEDGHKTVMELVNRLPFMRVEQVLKRWANHILRSYETLKKEYDQQLKAKEKYQQQQQQQAKKSTVVNDPYQLVVRQTLRQSSSQSSPLIQSRPRSNTAMFRPSKLSKEPSLIDNSQPTLITPLQPTPSTLLTLDELIANSYQYMVILLAYLSPETLWDMQDYDYQQDINKLPNFVQLVEKFLQGSNLDTRCLFIINAVNRITKDHLLLSMKDLYRQQSSQYLQDVLIQLFLKRPCLYNPKQESFYVTQLKLIEDFYSDTSLYLEDFNKETFDIMQIHLDKMREQRPQITQAFAFVQDCEHIYLGLREKLLKYQCDKPKPRLIVETELCLNKREQSIFNDIERQILNINKDTLFELVSMRQPYLNIQWAAKIEQTLKKYLYPLRRYLNTYINKEGTLTYFDMWRALKTLNLRIFNLDAREIEAMLIKIIRIKERSQLPQDQLAAQEQMIKDIEDNVNFDFTDEGANLKRQIKNEMLYGGDAANATSDEGRFKFKAKNKQDTLELLGLRGQYCKAVFSAEDFIFIMLGILFKIAPSDFVRELVTLTPSLKEEPLKLVNRMITKDKLYQHVEQYLCEYTPGVAFEHFLIQNVLIKRDSECPNSLNLMRTDFKSFLETYIDSLYAIYDFYINEYQTVYPQPSHFRGMALSPEVTYLFLQDLDAFNPETGLSKHSFKRILTYLQKPVSQDVITQSHRNLDQIFASHLPSMNSKKLKTTQDSSNPSSSNPQQVIQTATTVPKYRGKSQDKSKQQSQLSFEGFHGLTFFDFIELIYITAQYFNPDPLINMNQKFAEFIERTVMVNIQFKIKNKKIGESSQKERLVKVLQEQKLTRGTQIGTINSILELN